MSDKLSIPSINSKRIKIRYAEDGGATKDNVIELKPGIEDLSLGDRNYAQVRILVDETHYLKGMAIYAINPQKFPDGVDLIFNTSKHKGTPIDNILKPINVNALNPFDTDFMQWAYQNANGKFHVSPLNIVADDRDWERWEEKAKHIIANFLSKKDPTKPEYSSNSSAVDCLYQMLFAKD